VDKEVGGARIADVTKNVKKIPTQGAITRFHQAEDPMHGFQQVVVATAKDLHNARVSELSLLVGSIQVAHSLTQ
jgi:hypothetical protein